MILHPLFFHFVNPVCRQIQDFQGDLDLPGVFYVFPLLSPFMVSSGAFPQQRRALIVSSSSKDLYRRSIEISPHLISFLVGFTSPGISILLQLLSQEMFRMVFNLFSSGFLNRSFSI
ncbi:hypothetical protein NPIL_268051 [Nephila pilipes]|uniref:Uncharacterized protein n=1 Tax=Nephila pilipes TaxID=299642 RepID=A0A8X6USA1_NEPPI|nr:hypothetical protein NPIL_268051 [Nephila pilipes]